MNNMNMQNPMMNMMMNNGMMNNMGNTQIPMMNNMGNTQIPMMNNMNNMNPYMNNMQNQMMMNNFQTQVMNNMLMNNIMMNNLQNAMANQMNLSGSNMNNNQNFNNITPNDNNQSNILSVFFKFSKDINNPGSNSSDSNETTMTILCKSEDLVSTIIEKFRDKTNYRGKAQFIFNAKRLNENLTVGEAGIENNSNIFVITVKYAGGIN